MLQNQKQRTPAISESLRPLDKNDEHPLVAIFWMGVPLPKHFHDLWPKSIYDLTENLFYSRHGWHSCPKHNLWRVLVDSRIDNDEKVASSKKHIQFKTRVHKPYLIYDQNGQYRYPIFDQNDWKTIPFGAAHTYGNHVHPVRVNMALAAKGCAQLRTALKGIHTREKKEELCHYPLISRLARSSKSAKLTTYLTYWNTSKSMAMFIHFWANKCLSYSLFHMLPAL